MFKIIKTSTYIKLYSDLDKALDYGIEQKKEKERAIRYTEKQLLHIRLLEKQLKLQEQHFFIAKKLPIKKSKNK